MTDKNETTITEVTKICGICGDKALGYNFNAITCESCKAFFRRNALKNKEFKCPFEGCCKVDLVTRRFCQKCRLKKCFDIGMKKEWILSEEEKQIKRSKIAENRHKRQRVNKIAKVADSTTNTTVSPNLIQLIQNRFDNNERMATNFTNLKEHNSLPSIISYNSYRKSENNLISSSSELNTEAQNEFHFSPNKISYSLQIPNAINSNTLCDSTLKNLSFNHLNESSIPLPNSPLTPIISSSSSDSTRTSNKFQTTESNSAQKRHIDQKPVMTSLVEINNNCSNTSDESFKPTFEEIKTENRKFDESLETVVIPDIVYEKTIEVEFAQIPIRQTISQMDTHIRELNQLENNRLNELSIATTVLKMPLPRITSEATGLVDAIKMADQAIRRLIKVSKKINAFKSLCQSDQIALLKAGCTEILILRSVVTFNYESEYWTVYNDSNNSTLIKLDILKQAKGNIYEAHKKFMRSFRQEWNEDQNILDLLTVIILFTPDRPNTIHKDFIKLEQQTYIYLLQRYLEVKYSSRCEAMSRYLKLMTKLEELHILNEEHVRIYLEIDPNDVGPLLIEIFDLKH